MKFIIDDKIPYIHGALEPFGEVKYISGNAISHADCQNADALIIRTRTKCNASLLEGTGVKAIFTATIGFDHIDHLYCRKAGIHWESAPGCNSSSVQQYIGSVLAALHQQGRINVAGSTIAIVGVGNVGRKVSDWCRKLGMRVLRVDPIRAQVEGAESFTTYADALKQADIITFHVPLHRNGNFPTFHMLNTDTLGQLKKGVTIINSSRGEVCCTQALKEGVKNGTIANLIVDVWENEPNIDLELLSLATIATPHVAGYSYDSKRNGTEMSVRALGKYFGLPLQTWHPQSLPMPANPVITIDPNLNDTEAALSTMLQTYNVLADCQRFRENPQLFEKLRGDYALRREIGAFTLAPGTKQAQFIRQFGISFA